MNILILGCGYIGTEIASIWKEKGHLVTSTTRSLNRLDELSKISQKAVLIKGGDPKELFPLLEANDIILVTIAADSSKYYEHAYLTTSQIIRNLALETSLPKQLLYTSSTCVYGDHQGHWVDEEAKLLAKTNEAKILVETEKHYLSLQEMGWRVCLLRLAEIYGPNRELSKRVKKLQGQPLAGSGKNYTNMVHRSDCAQALDYALQHELQGIYNVADDDHPTRKELYDAVSQKFKLPKLSWDPEHSSLHRTNKRISNHKIKKEGFSFLYPHRVLI